MCNSPCCLRSHSSSSVSSGNAVFSSVYSVPASGEVSSAVATCGQAMCQLRKLTINYMNPLPLLLALKDRDCPLEHVTVKNPPRVCTILVCVDRTDDAMCQKLVVVSS